MEALDPYKAPKSDLRPDDRQGPAIAAVPLYSVRQMTVATLFGGPMAGALLMARNARTLQGGTTARNIVIAAVVASVVFMAVGFLPFHFPRSVLPIACTLSLRQAALASQGAALTRHFAEGGAALSNWRVAATTLACLLGTLAVGTAVVLVTDPLPT